MKPLETLNALKHQINLVNFRLNYAPVIPIYIFSLKRSQLQVMIYKLDFQRVFICPAESRLSFQHMRKFMAIDDTFLKSKLSLPMERI